MNIINLDIRSSNHKIIRKNIEEIKEGMIHIPGTNKPNLEGGTEGELKLR